MDKRYFCPDCQGNRTHFYLIKKLAQEVRKEADTGEITWSSEEWEEVLEHESPFVEVKCAVCGYTGGEGLFAAKARNN